MIVMLQQTLTHGAVKTLLTGSGLVSDWKFFQSQIIITLKNLLKKYTKHINSGSFFKNSPYEKESVMPVRSC